MVINDVAYQKYHNNQNCCGPTSAGLKFWARRVLRVTILGLKSRPSKISKLQHDV